MEKFNLPADTVDQYRNSVHGVSLLERGDPAAPTCNNCHGNHGAAPPEVRSIQEVDRLRKDFRMRKIGLGLATIFISFLALILYLYIRTLDKSQ